jgi:YesN/AraC family two-component response regulator
MFIASGLSREYAMRLMKLRYSGYLTKPFSLNELKEELNNLRY